MREKKSVTFGCYLAMENFYHGGKSERAGERSPHGQRREEASKPQREAPWYMPALSLR